MTKNQVLKGQTALITGAASGIGKAIALAMAEAGANVAVNFLKRREEAEAIASQIEEKGRRSIAIQANISKENEVKQMIATVKESFGAFDILVNNAGIQKDANFLEMKLEDWNAVIATNLTGQFLCTREAAKEFRSKKDDQENSGATGKIIFISSVHDRIPWAGHINYATSKGGLKMFMKTLAKELAPYKIRVNSISPGTIKTPINEAAWKDETSKQAALKKIPYGRLGVPEDIAKVAVWLASDESDYIHGATLYVDGGMTLFPNVV